ncbi:MAG TPA: hypothetical protein VH105_15240 [Burkholderiales bacterium]|jgi:hypothetical protein|nr:hypothetical protein [Burkholderiales bacterium]
MSTSDQNDNKSSTQRMQTLTGLQPSFAPGEFVYLNSAMPGFPDGTRFKVIAARAIGANQHRYELQGMGQTIWVLEADLRSTPPDSIANAPGYALPDRALSMTQRMQTMTLSQRMTALGLNTEDGPNSGSTQRLRVLNNIDGGLSAPPSGGPVTGIDIAGGTAAEPPKPDGKKPDDK